MASARRDRQRVYLEPEVQATAAVPAEHFSRVAYYRRDHAATRERLFAGVSAARRSPGLPQADEGV